MWTARVLIGGLMIVVGFAKLADVDRLAKEVRLYEMQSVLPDRYSHTIANLVPWFEVVSGALLLAGPWRREARIILFTMLGVFTIAKVAAVARGLNIECGCFGQIEFLSKALAGKNGVYFNLVLMAILAIETYASARTRVSTKRPQPGAAIGPKAAEAS